MQPHQVTGTTRMAAVIGDPVRHSLSPVIHNAAFEALGLDGVYVALPVPGGFGDAAVAAMRIFNWYGMSVTMPLKQDVMASCDGLTAAAQAINAVNCVYWQDGQIVGDSTDGDGFLRGLDADLGVTPAGLHCAIVGAGGAAKAVAHALASGGAGRVTVMNRTPDKAAELAALAGSVGVVGTAADLAAADVVINATPLGMGSTDLVDQVPFDVTALRSDAVVSDLIYHPAETRLLQQARTNGLRCQNGLPMLVFQAATAFERWTGFEAPVAAMAAAAEAAL